MIDIVGKTIGLLTEDAELMSHLGNNENAVYRVKSADAKLLPRIALYLLGDADIDYYDNDFRRYHAEIQISIFTKNDRSFDIGQRVNEILVAHDFERKAHSDRYDYDIDAYARDMVYECKILTEKSDVKWPED